MIVLRNLEIVGAERCDIEIDGRTIREIGKAEPSADAVSLEFENAIAFPGLVNSHDHLEFDCYRPLDGGPYRDYVEWAADIRSRHAKSIAIVEGVPRDLRVRLGIARNLLCGVTSVAHHGEAITLSGPLRIVGGTRAVHSPRLGGLGGLLVPDLRPVVAHVGEGIGAESEAEIEKFLRRNLWRKPLIGVHGIAMSPDQARRFQALVWCPVSNELLFNRTAPIVELKKVTSILFGTDSTLTGPWDIWTHLRRARALKLLADDELFQAVTSTAAKVWRLQGYGEVRSGGAADIVVARKRSLDGWDAFFAVRPQDILLVIKEGRVVLADASIRSLIPAEAALFPVAVEGAVKFTAEDYGKLATSLKQYLSSIPVPLEPVEV